MLPSPVRSTCLKVECTHGRRLTVILAIGFMLMCAALSGLVYMVVQLSKDTTIASTGAMNVRAGSTPVSTGKHRK